MRYQGKNYVRFDYDLWVSIGAPINKVILAHQDNKNDGEMVCPAVSMIRCDLPGPYPLLMEFAYANLHKRIYPESRTFARQASFNGELLGSEFNKDHGLYMEEIIPQSTEVKAYIISYSVVDREKEEVFHRRIVKRIFSSEEGARIHCKHWHPQSAVKIHEIMIPKE